MTATYKGFSTVGRSFKYRLTDFELAKQDFINHLQISKGEKLMNADFGTTIWTMLFENMTEDLRQELTNEIIRVASYDPRMSLTNINVVEFERGIQVELDMLYTGSVSPVSLKLEFETSSQTLSEI
jgi:phage baseplate assembly protein W